jgi:predicted Zn-dependent protease
MTSPARFAELARLFERTAESFRPLTRRERDGITELRLHVVRSRGNETLAVLGRRVGNAWTLEETAIANGLSTTARLQYGQTLKVALRGPYRPRP